MSRGAFTLVLRAAAVMALASAAPVSSCTVTPTLPDALGTYSPAAIKAGAVPGVQSRAGIACATAILSVLSNNYLRARFSSANRLMLVQDGGSATVAYKASADKAGSIQFSNNATIDYMQNNLLNLLGLLGGSSADLPLFIAPSSTVSPPPGTYRDTITIDWSWYQCPSVGLLGGCLTTAVEGTGRTTISVTLIVAAQSLVVTMSTAVTWDPASGTTNPKTIPGSLVRSYATVTNPDIVALVGTNLAVIVPTPRQAMISTSGDGTGSGAVIRLSDGNPASGVALTYAGPADRGDDVDFSANDGVSWDYVPVPGNAASEGAVTHVRLRPRGTMAKQSSFSVSIPYQVR